MATDSASGAAPAAAMTTGGGRRRRRRTNGAAVPSTTAPHAAARMALGPRIDVGEDIGARRTPGARRSVGTLAVQRPGARPARGRRVRRPPHPGDRGPRRHGRGLPGAPARPRPPRRAEAHRPAARRGPRLPRALRARVARRRLDRPPQRHPDLLHGRERRRAPCTSRCATSRAPTCARSCAPSSAWTRRAPRTSSPRWRGALDAAHARGIVHRDVKPANVLLGANDHAYLTDFGLTKRVTSHTGSTRDGGWVGTLGYVAPEQIRGERLDARADVYALGCVLYHSLAGVPPYQRESDEATLWAHLNDDPPSLHDRAPERARELRRRPGRAPWPRTPTTASRRPATSAARRWPPRASPWRRGPSAWWPSARPRPATARRPSSPPTRRRRCSPRADARARAGWWPWALAAVPIAGLALIAALALGGGDDGGGDSPARRRRARRAPPPPRRRRRRRSRASTSAGAPTTSCWPTARRGSCAAATTRLAVIDAKTRQARALQPARRRPQRRGRRLRQALGDQPGGAVAGADRAEVPPPGGPGRPAAGAGQGGRGRRRQQRRCGSASAATRACSLRIDPKNRAQPAKTIELPDGLQNITVGGGAVWIIARRAQHGHAPGHRQRHAAPDLRRREAVRRSPTGAARCG